MTRSTSSRTVSAGSQEFTDLLGQSTINSPNGIGDEATVVTTTTSTTETTTNIEYDEDGNEASRSASETTTTTTTTNVVIKDQYGGSAGGFSSSNSKSVESAKPQISKELGGLTSDAVNYRATNGVSITNREEFAGKVASQQRAAENWDRYNPMGGVALGYLVGKPLAYGTGASLLLGGATQVVSMSLQRGLEGLQAQSKKNPCNNCTKSYPVR